MNDALESKPRTLSYCQAGGKAPLLWDTIDGRFRFIAESCGDVDALVSVPQGRRLTYREFDAEIERVALGLLGLGVAPGEHVGVWATDNAEWVLLQMATARIGVVLVNINPAYRLAELEHALKLAKVKTLCLMPAFRKSHYVEMVAELCPEVAKGPPSEFSAKLLPDLRRIVVFDPEAPERTERPHPGMFTWQELLEAGRGSDSERVRRIAAQLDPDDAVNIQFTSGTTGFPKAVVLTHHNVVNNAYFGGLEMGFRPGDKLCVPVPFYHCFGMVLSNLACFVHGATLVIPESHFDAVATLRAIEAERCTAVHGVPTMFNAELHAMDEQKFDVSSLRTGIMAGAPCPPELVRRVMQDMGCEEILIGYGQTECSPLSHMTRAHDSFERRVESVGTNMPHTEVKVIDTATGAVAPLGQAGEICFRGYHVMRGYFADEQGTRSAIDGAGWLHSGDLGVMDPDGYVRITGRLKDMIIRGGENVYPAEIEALLMRHPKISEAAVFGVPDERLGEEISTWIKLRQGEKLEVEDLQAWVKTQLAHYKVPRNVWFVEQFPMTVTGKIQKHKIRETVAEWIANADTPVGTT